MPNNYRTIQSKRRKKKTDSAPSDTTTQPGKAFNYSHWFAVPLTVYVLQIDSFIIDNWSMLKKHLPEITQTRTPRNPSPFIICSQKKKHIMSPHPTHPPILHSAPGALDVWDPSLAIYVHLPELQHLCHGDHIQTKQVASHVQAILGVQPDSSSRKEVFFFALHQLYNVIWIPIYIASSRNRIHPASIISK